MSDTTTPGSRDTSAPEDPRVVEILEAARRIGHDLNNVLGILGGRAELLQIHLQKGKPEEAARGAEIILNQVERIRGFSEALRDLRKVAGPGPS